jgi:hypothetical protein
MFNRNIAVIQPTRVEVREVTKQVHEHRAPTDDSVKLLREMEAAAVDKIEQSLHVGDATFDCVVHFQRRHVDQSIHLKAIFSLNGKRMVAEHVEHTDRYDKVTALNGLLDAMAKQIAAEILTPALRPLMTNTEFAR